MLPTPTATVPAMLDEIQRTIFSPRCAIPTCHDANGQVGNLVLDTAHNSYAQLVGVAPNIDAAHAAGFLRVDPGHPENSFLLVKLQGPPPGEGRRMPEVGAPLTDETDTVYAVTTATVNGRLAIIAGDKDHSVRLWDAATRGFA